MSAIPITLCFSLLLAGLFVALFAREHRRRRFASAERDSLLPLADESPRAEGWASVSTPTPVAAGESGDHLKPNHRHAPGDSCGCRDGSRPPCAGCLRRREVPAQST